MVDKTVLEYFRINRGNYKLEDLKKKVLAAGYTKIEVDEAIALLNSQSGGNPPSVSSTINKINKMNIQTKSNGNGVPLEPKPLVHAGTVQPVAVKGAVPSKGLEGVKKSRKWLWIGLGVVGLILILGVGFGVWWIWLK